VQAPDDTEVNRDGGKPDEPEEDELDPRRKAEWEAMVDRLFRRSLWVLLASSGFLVGMTLSMEIGLAISLAAVALVARYPEFF
jgi:hypothetical protein